MRPGRSERVRYRCPVVLRCTLPFNGPSPTTKPEVTVPTAIPHRASAAARSLQAFGAYLLGAGAMLIEAPALMLAPLGIVTPPDVWIRMVGLLAMCLGSVDLLAARAEVRSLIAWSVWRRGLAAVVIVAFVLAGFAPVALCLFAAIDAAAALWTAWALRRPTAQAQTPVQGAAARKSHGAKLACVSLMLAAAVGALVLPASAIASVVSFQATMSGDSAIVGVLDPTVPIVQVQTSATGSGVLGIQAYRSGDIVNFATGAGSGTNVFENALGDELYASFDVQLVPLDSPGAFLLFGTNMIFTGGTGIFAGASGTGSFTGSGQFISPSEALTRFVFDGELTLVPLPGTVPLALAALALLVVGRRGRRLASGRRMAANV